MPRTEVCRLCLHQAITACSLLQNNSNKMLESLTSIKVDSSNEFSTISCLKCYLDLKLAYKIQQKFLRTNKKLRDILQRNAMKEEVEETIKCEEIILNVENNDPLCILSDDNNSLNQEKEIPNEDYQCIYCDKMFSGRIEYTEHVLSHSQTILYACTHCDSKYQNESLLNTHLQKFHYEFSKQNDSQLKNKDILLVSEQADDNNEKEVKSDELDMQIKDLNDKLNKLNQNNVAVEPPRDQTQKQEDTRSVLYVCEICGKKFTLKRMLQNHSRNHTITKRKPCPICKKEITVDNLSKHIKVHEDKPKICEKCGKTYANVESLRGHMFHIHRGKIYECKSCNVTFKSRQSFNIHRKKQHIGTPSYVCDTCGRKFFFRFDLKKHTERTHLKMRPYICDFCHRGFSGLHAMKTHRRQHTNETPYKCEECGEGFRQNVSLKAHKKSKHNIVEPITSECKVCGKGFASEHAVKAHMRLH